MKLHTDPGNNGHVSYWAKIILACAFALLVVFLLAIVLAAFTGVYHLAVAAGFAFVYVMVAMLVVALLWTIVS